MKAKFNQMLDDQKRQVQVIEETIQMTKSGYADSLKELEKISEEIHERRQKRKAAKTKMENQAAGEFSPQEERAGDLGVRGEGVGSECPDPDRTTGAEG